MVWDAMRRGAVLLAAMTLALTLAPAAEAELAQRGDLFVRFDGGISPKALPRDELAPIGVRIEGTIKTPEGEVPPGLRRIELQLSRGGRLSTRGLPVCNRGRIAQATPSEALAACGTALVGAGGMVARTDLPDQSTALVRGEITLFNSIVDGRPAILAHVFQTKPTPTTRIVVFSIRHRPGAFGTVITTQLPTSLNRNGYLESIFLQLQRNYVFEGRRRAYLSASCAAPAGFPGAVFTFARASMSFDDGRTLSSTMTRSCKVRR